MDNGPSVPDMSVLNTHNCVATEFSDAEAGMTEAARLSSGPYIDNEARTVIACCRASAQPPREHLGSVPRHQPWAGRRCRQGWTGPIHQGG